MSVLANIQGRRSVSRTIVICIYGLLILMGIALSLYLDAVMVAGFAVGDVSGNGAGGLAVSIVSDIRCLGKSLWMIVMGLLSSVTLATTIGSGAVIFSIASSLNVLFTVGITYAMMEA